MAIIKRRVMSRGRILAIMADRALTRDEQPLYSSEDRRNAELDLLCHMLADDKTVKVYNDTNLGGMVVEYDDGK